MASNGYSTALHYSARNGNKKIVEKLLNRGLDVNARGEHGETPLYAAINSGNIKVIEVLLNWKASVNVKNVFGTSPLYIATQRDRDNNEKIVELLLSRGAEVDAQGPSGMTALHKAALNGYVQISKQLLKRGASVSSVCTHNFAGGYTPLHLAADNGRVDIVKLLLSNNAFVDPYTEDHLTPLYIATAKGYVKVVKVLLEHWADVDAKNTNGITLLHVAVEKGSVKIVKLLLDRNACVDAYYDYVTPLFVATIMRREKVVKLLLEHKADVNAEAKDGMTVMHVAAQRGNLRIVELLLSYNARVDPCNEENLTPVFLATQMEHAEVVKLLLYHKANVDAHDNDGQTILYFAVKNRNRRIVEHILNYYPDVNNESNRKSLDMAIYNVGFGEHWRTIIQKFLEYGFTVVSKDNNNNDYFRLLYAAADKGYLRIVEDILKLSIIDVNKIHVHNVHVFTHGWNQTLLHNAIKNGWEILAKLLISHGADVNVKDAAGRTSVYYVIKAAVEENKAEEVAKLLGNFKVDINAIDKSGNIPMFEVTKSTDLKMLELLLTNGANLKDPQLLNMAVKLECGLVVTALLQHGVDINSNACDKYGRTALHFTASKGRETILIPSSRREEREENMAGIAKLLLSNGADVNARSVSGSTTLYDACALGYVKVVEAILDYSNVNLNSTGTDGYTPLCLAAKKGNEIIIQMLLNRGADINARGRDGNSPLAIGTKEGHLKVAEMLLNCGAEVDSKCIHGITPLHLATQKRHLDIFELLLKFGADIDSRDMFNRTAFFIAAETINERILTTVLEYGCDINTTRGEHFTTINIAVAIANTHLSLLFRRPHLHGSNWDSEISTFKNILKATKEHLIKMKAANLYVSEKNLMSFPRMNYYNNNSYYQLCEREVETMTSEKIGDSDVSIYSILTKNVSQLAGYARNKNIVEILNSHEFEMKFPIYCKMIIGNFRKGIRRRYLLDEGTTLFHALFNYLPELPYIAVENIFSNMSNEDLIVSSKSLTLMNMHSNLN